MFISFLIIFQSLPWSCFYNTLGNICRILAWLRSDNSEPFFINKSSACESHLCIWKTSKITICFHSGVKCLKEDLLLHVVHRWREERNTFCVSPLSRLGSEEEEEGLLRQASALSCHSLTKNRNRRSQVRPIIVDNVLSAAGGYESRPLGCQLLTSKTPSLPDSLH